MRYKKELYEEISLCAGAKSLVQVVECLVYVCIRESIDIEARLFRKCIALCCHVRCNMRLLGVLS